MNRSAPLRRAPLRIAPGATLVPRLRSYLKSIAPGQIVIESWRRHYNTITPHASIGSDGGGERLPAIESLQAPAHSQSRACGSSVQLPHPTSMAMPASPTSTKSEASWPPVYTSRRTNKSIYMLPAVFPRSDHVIRNVSTDSS